MIPSHGTAISWVSGLRLVRPSVSPAAAEKMTPVTVAKASAARGSKRRVALNAIPNRSPPRV